MGCWNGTCMISNLPILAGEEIKLVILYSPTGQIKGLSNLSGFCYSTDLLRPAFFPLTGKYNDYGMIEEIVEDWCLELTTNILKKHYPKIMTERRSDVKEFQDYTIYDFLEGIERGSLKVSVNNEFEWSPFSFVMIRKDIWDGIVTNQKSGLCYWNDRREGTDDYYIDAVTYCKRKIESSLNDRKKHQKLGIGFISSFDRIFGFEDSLMYNSIHTEYIVTNIEQNPQIVEDYIGLKVINTFLSITRKAWMIQPGSGAQNTELEPYLLLNQLISNVAETHKKYYDG